MSTVQQMTAPQYRRHRLSKMRLVKIDPKQVRLRLDEVQQKYAHDIKETIEILQHDRIADELNDCTVALGEMALLYQLRQRGHFATESDMVRAVAKLKAEADDFLLRFLSQSCFISDDTRPTLTHDTMTHDLFPE